MSPTIIVIPCYNEAGRLEIHKFRSFARPRRWLKFLFVNDGSTDETPGVLRILHEADPDQFEVYDLPQNVGKAEAVRRGVLQALACDPEFVGFWDADLATPLEAIDEFCGVLQSNTELQMAIGARVRLLGRQIERRPLRHYLGRMFATAASLILKLPIYDTQCGAKMFRAAPEVRRHFEEPFHTNWVFDVELLARFIRGRKAAGQPAMENAIYEVPLEQWCEVAGSKVRPRDFVKAVFELATIYRIYLRGGASSPQPVADVLPAPHLQPRASSSTSTQPTVGQRQTG